MSERDTMFNEQDRRCAAAQLMPSTDLSYENRTIASTLKMQIRMVQHAQGDKNKVSGYGYGLWCGFKWGPHHATSHLRSRLESQHQSVPGCAEEYGDPRCNQVAGGRPWVWQQDPAPAHKFKRPRLGFRSSAMTLYPSLVEKITNMTSHNTKASLIAAIRRVFAELPPALLEKACSQFRIRTEAVIEAEGGYVE